MGYRRDTSSPAGSGHLAIIVSTIVFVLLLLIAWALMGFQLYQLRQQRLADLESGVAVGPIAGDVPLDDVLKGVRYSQTQPVRTNRSPKASLAVTHEGHTGSSNTLSKSRVSHDSAWYREQYLIHYLYKIFKSS
ncbi:hypothetical protein F4680DRAFT_449803 [Xylaria scruposa]|nr:hypothetical protein F4680DRAFT_449803 [Xylaria scruposa]